MICVSPVRRKVRRDKPTENGLEFHFSTKKRFASQVRSQETSPGRKGGGWRRKKGEGGRRKQKKDGSRKKRAVPPIRGTAQNRICYVHSKHKKHARSLQRREMARSCESVIEMPPQKRSEATPKRDRKKRDRNATRECIAGAP